MVQFNAQFKYRLILIIAVILASGPVSADKPPWAGGGKHGKKEKQETRGGEEQYYDDEPSYDGRRTSAAIGAYFGERQRAAVRNYYAGEFRAGRCPPGLAKKQNGCLPPGQAKKWVLGRPLPQDEVYYDLPEAIIGLPPEGYKFVRIASDILMISVGTGMVIDAIQDLGGM